MPTFKLNSKVNEINSYKSDSFNGKGKIISIKSIYYTYILYSLYFKTILWIFEIETAYIEV